jgi:predicted small secreted protein
MRGDRNLAPLLVAVILASFLMITSCTNTTAGRNGHGETISPEVESEDGDKGDVAISFETFLPRSDGTLVLIAGGCGYEPGDIVSTKEDGTPLPGDVVQYSDRQNGSDGSSFGPGRYLARVVAMPGEEVVFHDCEVTANGFVAVYECSDLRGVSWGKEHYEDVAGRSLLIPDVEFLADRMVGQDWDRYNRLTVRQDAVIAVIVEKIGHDKRAEEYLKRIVY